METNLSGRVVLVSGGARGIGAATVRAFAKEGAWVVAIDRDKRAGEAMAKSVDKMYFLEADLDDAGACEQAIADVVRRFRAIDVLVNNAGSNDALSLDAPPARFLESVRKNLLHVYALTHHAREHLARAKGAIVNVSSKVAETGQGHTSGYAAAKGAINALTREWAVALAPEGVRVNAVIPAECDSDQYQRWFEKQPDPRAARASVERLVPLGGRLTRPEEIADTIVFLASGRAGHITGQLIHVDGGYTHLDRALSAGGKGWS
ncbi:MAG: SDR family oxidoreductase [Verrucomicrobia bacterium]|nr:MAG: SDR family oxidoreductase [Verrucomicrobiota bacterium]